MRFDDRFSDLPEIIWRRLAKIDELKGHWIGGASLSPQILGRLKQSVLITSSGASTRIEGSNLTDEDVEKLMRGLSVHKFKDRDASEVKGYFELLTIVFENFEHIPLTENSIKHLHKELLKYVDKDKAHLGEYKKLENKVGMFDRFGNEIAVVFKTTPPFLVAKEMSEIIEWTNRKLDENEKHPLLVIANFVVEFLKIHPFQDGNGRLSRVLTNLLLLKAGYAYVPYVSHEKLVEENKSEYYVALRRTQTSFGTKNETLVAWLEFFLSVCEKQAQLAVAYISEDNVDKFLSINQLLVWEYLKKVGTASPLEIAVHTHVARPTINQVLSKLLKMKRIEKLGLGRATRYQVL